jgi:hypothetical protein
MRTASIIRGLMALMMEAVRTSKTSVNFNVTTRRCIPKDSKRHNQKLVLLRRKCCCGRLNSLRQDTLSASDDVIDDTSLHLCINFRLSLYLPICLPGVERHIVIVKPASTFSPLDADFLSWVLAQIQNELVSRVAQAV